MYFVKSVSSSNFCLSTVELSDNFGKWEILNSSDIASSHNFDHVLFRLCFELISFCFHEHFATLGECAASIYIYKQLKKKNDILLSISALPVNVSFTSFLFAFRFIHNRICLPYLQCNFNTADTMSPNIPNPQSNGRSTDATKGPTNIPRRQCIPILYTRGTHYDIGFDVVNIH